MKRYSLVFSVILVCSHLNNVHSQQMPLVHVPIPVNNYSDPANGLSFQYPMVWKKVTDPGGIFGSTIFQSPGVQGSGVPIRVAVQFRAEGTAYASTTLESLDFLYGVVAHSTAASCRKVITDVDAMPKKQTIQDVVYTHGTGGDAGMSQTLSSQIYSTFRQTTCYVFEADTNQTNGIVRDGQRQMTKAEQTSLQNSLNNIIVTVRFSH